MVVFLWVSDIEEMDGESEVCVHVYKLLRLFLAFYPKNDYISISKFFTWMYLQFALHANAVSRFYITTKNGYDFEVRDLPFEGIKLLNFFITHLQS